jgi:predicted amidohydrolase YtcJ
VTSGAHSGYGRASSIARDEHRRGKLRPGYLADLVVLGRDPYAFEPEGFEKSEFRHDAWGTLDTQSAAVG